MRKLFSVMLAVLVSLQLAAQKPFKKNTLYGEFAGNGIFLSANYERQLGDKPGLGVHIGIGTGDEKPFIPLGASYLFHLKNNKSFLETGLGVTLAERYAWDSHGPSNPTTNAYKAAVIPSVGYRHQTPYGLMWRISYTPVLTGYRTIPWFAGISAGWRL